MSTAAQQAALRERRKNINPDAWRALTRQEQADFRHRHPEKKSAWNKVYKAVKDGRLVRPERCERCLVPCKPEASHDDYSRPLEVEWLCKKCHIDKDTTMRKVA